MDPRNALRFVVGAGFVAASIGIVFLGLVRSVPEKFTPDREGSLVLVVGKARRPKAGAGAQVGYACEDRTGTVLVLSDTGPPPDGALVVIVGHVAPREGEAPVVDEWMRFSLP